MTSPYQPDLFPETLPDNQDSQTIKAHGRNWKFIPMIDVTKQRDNFPYCHLCDWQHDIACLRLPHCNGLYRQDNMSGYYKLIS